MLEVNKISHCVWEKLITITNVLITVSGIFVMHIVRSGGDQEFR